LLSENLEIVTARAKFWLLLNAVGALGCSRRPVDQPPAPSSVPSGVAPAASSDASTPAPTDVLHAEVDGNGLHWGMGHLPFEPLTIRAALARARGSASALTVTVPDGADPKAIWAVLLGARGTELGRVTIERGANVIAIELQGNSPAPRQLLLLQPGQLELAARDRNFDRAVLHVTGALTVETLIALMDAIYSPTREAVLSGKVERVPAFTLLLSAS